MSWSLSFCRPVPGSTSDGSRWLLSWPATAVMGVINVTPDSFSDGGLVVTVEQAVARAQAMAEAGGLVVDIGGESTRPGAVAVDVGIEIDRVVPVIEAIVERVQVVVSIDTRHVQVAAAAIAAGAHMVNDITGLTDERMVDLCASTATPAVVMHMQGEPQSMQVSPSYIDVVGEVSAFLAQRADAVLARGVPSVLVDPGIGFGKTIAHNLALLRALPLQSRHPVLVGASRKGFIGTLAGVPVPADRDPGSIATHLFAAQHGAAMVRVHDVAGHVQALAIDAALRDRPSP